jgi:nicotinate dehydrogenase subunit B
VHGNVLQTTSRALQEQVAVEPQTGTVATREWGSYPILSFRQVPVIEVVVPPRPGEPVLGAGESSSVPGTAAIANAIFDATGVRFRQPPFTPEVVRAALNPLADASGAQVPSHPASHGAEGWATAGADGRGIVPPGAAGDAGAHSVSSSIASSGSTVSGADAGPARAAPPPAWVEDLAPNTAPPAPPAPLGAPRAKPAWARALALVTGAFAALAGLAGLVASRPALAPITGVNAGAVYSAETLERGRQLAALGNCAGCHTAEGGAAYAGGRPLETPFGTIYATNLTPDPATGIGRWSFSAFQRAMREGVSHDGRMLYPAFPYTAFTRMTDDEVTALYAYLMAQPAVPQATPTTELRAPFNLRPLMHLWNALHLQPGPRALPAASLADLPAGVDAALWQRGEYLVNGPGHCGACHTPRDAMGAEKTGSAYLSGAWVDGWHAPSLTAVNRRTLPWSETALLGYLKLGHSAAHGVAVGPMAQVVGSLQGAPEQDLRAMAHYLATLQGGVPTPAQATPSTAAAAPPSPGPDAALVSRLATEAVTRARALAPLPDATQRLFEGACGACHSDGVAPVELGLNLPLATNSKLQADQPDNLLRVLLDGIQRPATRDIGFMPGFRHALDDAQLAELALWLRRRYAPDHPAWPGLQAMRERVAQVRGAPRSDR